MPHRRADHVPYLLSHLQEWRGYLLTSPVSPAKAPGMPGLSGSMVRPKSSDSLVRPGPSNDTGESAESHSRNRIEPSLSPPHPPRNEAKSDGTSLEALVYERLSDYANSLQGHLPKDMYRLIMPQLERPLIKVALELSGGEKTRAAKMLGIHRNTLRARLRVLGLEEEPEPRKRAR